MLERIKERINIQRRITEMVLAEEAKARAYRALVGESLNYAIIQDMVNTVTNHPVEVTCTLKDGTSFKIVRQARDEKGRIPSGFEGTW